MLTNVFVWSLSLLLTILSATRALSFVRGRFVPGAFSTLRLFTRHHRDFDVQVIGLV